MALWTVLGAYLVLAAVLAVAADRSGLPAGRHRATRGRRRGR